MLAPRVEPEAAGLQRTEVRGPLASREPRKQWSKAAGRNGRGRDRREAIQQHVLRRRRAELTQPRETQNCARATSQATTAVHHNGSHGSTATPMWTNISKVSRVGANHADAHARNQSVAESVRQSDGAERAERQTRRHCSGGSSRRENSTVWRVGGSHGVDGVSFREKLDRETHRSRNLKCAAGRHPPFQLRLLSA